MVKKNGNSKIINIYFPCMSFWYLCISSLNIFNTLIYWSMRIDEETYKNRDRENDRKIEGKKKPVGVDQICSGSNN